jgi:hypothetical protein
MWRNNFYNTLSLFLSIYKNCFNEDEKWVVLMSKNIKFFNRNTEKTRGENTEYFYISCTTRSSY